MTKRFQRPPLIAYDEIVEAARQIAPTLPREGEYRDLAEAMYTAMMEYARPRILSWPPFGFMVYQLVVLDIIAQEQGYTGLQRYAAPYRRRKTTTPAPTLWEEGNAYG